MKLVFATNNQHKVQEVSAALPHHFEVLTLKAIGCEHDIPETAPNLEGNARLKAAFIRDNFQLNCFADDTGLEVEALHGAPGVLSARYAGPQKNSEDNMDLLLQRLQGQQNRKARFRTAICLLLDGKEYLFEGIVNGTILAERKGGQGFGYDPIFQPDGYDRSFAEMTIAEKNQISHRGIAVAKLIEFLNAL